MEFDQLRRRLHQALESVDTKVDAGRLERTLRQRSRELAARRLEVEGREVFAQVIVVRRAGVTLAAPISSTNEVRKVKLIELPGGDDVIVGVFQVRGRSYCLVDLAPLLGEKGSERDSEKVLVMLVNGSPGELGLEIDEVLGARTVYADEIDNGRQEQGVSFVSHITQDLVHVIDIEALMALPAIRISGR
jgi:chemotaxis signal transduction protein